MADLRITPASATTRAITPIRFPELQPSGETFGAALGRAINGVGALQQQAQDAAAAVASGQNANSAQAVTTIEKANISFQYALAIRNKLLDAYQEIMRMTV
jgi:flagellar hook-basal body complex protein FliE